MKCFLDGILSIFLPQMRSLGQLLDPNAREVISSRSGLSDASFDGSGAIGCPAVPVLQLSQSSRAGSGFVYVQKGQQNAISPGVG